MKNHDKNIHGNALFLILIAVALFAALSFAVVQSGRGGGNIERETRLLQTSAAYQYVASIEQAVQKLMLLNGCSETDISFEHTTSHAGYLHSPVAEDRCKVFHADGGGVTAQDIDPKLLNSSFSASNGYGTFLYTGGLRVGNSGTATLPELSIVMPYLTEAACAEINNRYNNTTTIPRYNGNWNPTDGAMIFNGDYVVFHGFVNGTTGGGCLDTGADPGGIYMYYHVLHAR